VLLNNRETEQFGALRRHGSSAQAKSAIADVFHQARQAVSDAEYIKAALHYASLAQFMPRNQNLPMRAARSYQKANRNLDAARWYLEAAERYADMHQTTQAIATLRLYHEVAPDEHDGPKRIFELCRKKGDPGTGLFEFLSPKEQAAQQLRAEDIFTSFDDAAFDVALDAMTTRQLHKGDVLARTGDKAQSIFIIVRGRVQVFLTLKGRRTELGYLGQGDICSVIPYFSGGRHASEAIAMESTSLLELPYPALDSLRQSSPEFRAKLDALYRKQIFIKQLALVPVFSKMDAKTRQECARHMTLVTFKAGETLFHEGDSNCDVYLVRSGSVAINLNINQQERLYKTMKTGALVGEINIATKGKRTATARAVSDCLLARLDCDIYQRLYEGSVMLQKILMQRINRQARETREFIRKLNMIEDGDTCELLLHDIWRADSGED